MKNAKSTIQPNDQLVIWLLQRYGWARPLLTKTFLGQILQYSLPSNMPCKIKHLLRPYLYGRFSRKYRISSHWKINTENKTTEEIKKKN